MIDSAMVCLISSLQMRELLSRGDLSCTMYLSVKIYFKMYNQRKATPNRLMKLDLREAYDIVAWDFIEEIMTKLGVS